MLVVVSKAFDKGNGFKKFSSSLNFFLHLFKLCFHNIQDKGTTQYFFPFIHPRSTKISTRKS